MAPKKGKKISLNEFLGDSGSWADEMDSLPNAPAQRTDEERANDRYGRRDDFLSSRPDRGSAPHREDLPLPTQPPYTAFIGNLAFDVAEQELEEFFGSGKTKSIKIIKDREDKPKGFGYVEFIDIEGLKDGLTKTGASFSGRTIRVSVAEPPKERSGFGGFEDDSKFDNPWRRDGPLPDLHESRDSSRRRFDGPTSGERLPPSISEGASDWRSSRPARIPSSEPDGPPSYKRKGSGFSTPDGQTSAADKEEVWTIGGKFKPAADGPEENSGSKFGSGRGRGEVGLPRESVAVDEIDWRSSPRIRPTARGSASPNDSTPPTPQLGRRKLELLPRSGNVSAISSPLSSPRMNHAAASSSNVRSNPFGAAKPVDVSSREKEVTERVEKERESAKDRLTHSMSRTSSRTASLRSPATEASGAPSIASPGTLSTASPKLPTPVLAATVRPSLSFANAAAKKEVGSDNFIEEKGDDEVQKVTEKVADVGV